MNSGIYLDDLDPQVRPQDDLYRHVNGKWLDTFEIPDDRASDGHFRTLVDLSEVRVRDIIQELGDAAAAGQVTDPVARKVGDLYASFMDTARIAELGVTPIAADLARIQAAANPAELAVVLGNLQRTGGGGAVGLYINNDARQPDEYRIHLFQAGLGLPDEAYYRDPQHAEVLAKYAPHIARMLVLGGAVTEAESAAAAARVVALETHLATSHWDVVTCRDEIKAYNPMTFRELVDSAPGFDWWGWAGALGAIREVFDGLIVAQPSFATGFANLWATAPLADWKLWAAYHLISAAAPILTDELVEANFDFYGRTLVGTPQVRERWKRGVSLVESCLGEAVGQIYVAKFFPPEAKAKMEELVANLVAAYRESITALDWMGPETKAKALTKLEKFVPKIGYPAKWRSYGELEIDPKDLAGNVRRANAAETDRELAKIGKPIDRDEWFMNPQNVNAYYNPGMNEIVFPAAILQPPFFDITADDAANYGAIGSIIGHEIGHGFDDQGSQYDGDGLLVDWWTPEDRTEFERRTAALVAQYNKYVPEQLLPDGPHVNGELTVGENIGDLGGLAIAIKAYQLALRKAGVIGGPADAPVLDGLTGMQRLFLSWAQAWQSKARDEYVLQLLAVDEHAPNEFRCNGVVANLPQFHEAFKVRDGDRLYLPPSERVEIW